MFELAETLYDAGYKYMLMPDVRRSTAPRPSCHAQRPVAVATVEPMISKTLQPGG